MHDYISSVIRSSVILTGSYVASTVLSEVHGQNQLVLYVDFTKGSLTTAEIKVEFSTDGTNYYQEVSELPNSGSTAVSLVERVLSATGAYQIFVPIKARYVKVSAKGTGTVTNSLMAITAIVGTV